MSKESLVCEKCEAVPFGVQSWLVPRGCGVKRSPILCPDCSGLPRGLNIIEKQKDIPEGSG